MLHLVELHYSRETRDALLMYFDEHGVTPDQPGISVVEGWVATEDFIAYLIVKADSAAHLDAAVQKLRQFGQVTHRHVTSIEDLAQ